MRLLSSDIAAHLKAPGTPEEIAMDPSLFRIDWEVLAEAMAAIIVLSFFVERALSLIFEHRLYIEHLDEKGLKEPIAFGLSYPTPWWRDGSSTRWR
jgi:hypothetical protein